MGKAVSLTLRDTFGGVGTQVPSVVTCGKRRDAAGQEAGVYHRSLRGRGKVVVLLTVAWGRDGAQATRKVCDYPNCRTRTNRYECTGENQYLTQCHLMS